MKIFITHTKKAIKGEELQKALNAVADDLKLNAIAVRKENPYAPHITESEKEKFLQERLDLSENVRKGLEPVGFWLWQRINEKLTGECVAFLPRI